MGFWYILLYRLSLNSLSFHSCIIAMEPFSLTRSCLSWGCLSVETYCFFQVQPISLLVLHFQSWQELHIVAHHWPQNILAASPWARVCNGNGLKVKAVGLGLVPDRLLEHHHYHLILDLGPQLRHHLSTFLVMAVTMGVDTNPHGSIMLLIKIEWFHFIGY